MFGYLRVQKSELRVREWEAYRSVYCGLCRQMGKDYSFLTRLTLSYDCTFYAILLMSLHRSCKGFDKGRCCFNPMKKCGFARCEGDAYSKAAALSVIAAFYKLQDDLSDSGFFKRLVVRLVKPFFSRWHRKAAKKYPELETVVEIAVKLGVSVEWLLSERGPKFVPPVDKDAQALWGLWPRLGERARTKLVAYAETWVAEGGGSGSSVGANL